MISRQSILCATVLLVNCIPIAASEPDAVREWTFDRTNDRAGWTVPSDMTGAVMGGSL